MVSRPHLAVVPVNGLPPRARVLVLRTVAVVAILVAVAALAYAGARYTSLFALDEIEVTGGSPAVAQEVKEAGAAFLGQSLVSLDRDEVRRRLAALPTVRWVSVDRAFPHTLRVFVVPEEALAIVRNGKEAWLVSDRGSVIEAAPTDLTVRRPLIWTASEPDLEPGAVVESENVLLALAALRALPGRGLPERVQAARASEGELALVLESGLEVRLGRADQLRLKLAVAAKVLGAMGPDDRAGLTYLDVSVPEKVVGGSTLDSQPEG